MTVVWGLRNPLPSPAGAFTLALGLSSFALACGSRTGLRVDGFEDQEDVPSEEPLDSSCILRTHQTHGLSTDLYFLLDKSSSMQAIDADSTTRWQAVSAAMGEFLSSSDSAGLGAGIAFFPVSASGNSRTTPEVSCETRDYETPVVPMGTLPGVAQAM